MNQIDQILIGLMKDKLGRKNMVKFAGLKAKI